MQCGNACMRICCSFYGDHFIAAQNSPLQRFRFLLPAENAASCEYCFMGWTIKFELTCSAVKVNNFDGGSNCLEKQSLLSFLKSPYKNGLISEN